MRAFNERLLCAIVFLAAAARVGADSSSPTMLIYAPNDSNTPAYRIWSGTAWGSPANLPSVGGFTNWVVARNCPTRNETACVTLDQNNDANVAIFNGTTWGGVTEVCSDTAESWMRSMDAAYESISGDLVIGYWNAAATKIGYRTFSGGSVSSESLLTLPANNTASWVRLVPSPINNNILLLAQNSSGNLYACIWNGTAWGSVSTLESSVSASSYECFAGAAESISGRFIAAYGENGNTRLRYRVWDGSGWSGEASGFDTGATIRWVRMASDPVSNEVLCASLDDQSDVNVAAWNGSAWGSHLEPTVNVHWNDRRQVDLAYEAGGTAALLMYGQKDSNTLRYRTWNGSSWSSESSASNAGNKAPVVALVTGTSTGEIFQADFDDGNDLNARRWSGTALSSHTELSGTIEGGQQTQSFMVCVPATAPLVPADIPYATDFESAVGAEWSSATITSNGDLTKFAGRFAGTDRIKLALHTTAGESYEIVFDLYVIDGWSGESTEDGPDSFEVLVDDVAHFHETFTQRADETASYAFPPDQQGHYGWDSGHEEGAYRRVSVTFRATSTVTYVTFDGNPTGEIEEESWGIDNVRVDVARFRDVTALKKLSFTGATSDEYLAGLHWADVDNDGDLDCVTTGASTQGGVVSNTDAGAELSWSKTGSGKLYGQGAIFDFDHDGDLDFWVPAHNQSWLEKLFLNNGGGLSEGGGPGFTESSGNENSVATDVNGDGWADIVMFSENGNWIGHHGGSASASLTATNASSYGLNDAGDSGDGLSCASGDVNNDGLVDFFYLHGAGKLFLSNGDGTYARNNHGIAISVNAANKCGAALGDYDNDGDLDLYVARYDALQSGYFWKNEVTWSSVPASGNFTNAAIAAGITDRSGRRSCAWGDYDNDGDLDLLVATRTGRTILYRNNGDGSFSHADEGAGVTGDCLDATFVDFDNDGDLDIAVARLNESAVLLENRTDNTNYLKVRVVGAGAGKTNKAAVGTRVELWSADGTQLLARRDVGGARGGGIEPLWLHFGGVDPAATYELRTYFAGGTIKKSVTPGAVSTAIGGRVIPQMITVEEKPGVRIIQWSEVRNRASGG